MASETKSEVATISHEIAFLETYFSSIAQFEFDHAREYAEKEKAESPVDKSIYGNFITSLVTLADAEKNYFAMAFIERKMFRQTLKPMYNNLSAELHLAKEESTNLHDVEALAADLRKQMEQFTQARLKMIEFYEYFVKCKSTHVRNTPDILKSIYKVNETYTKAFHHPVLDRLKTSFNFEVEILSSLLSTEQRLCEWEFLESLLSLRECQSKLHAWRFLSPSNSVKEQMVASFTYKLFFKAKKQHETPALYQWLQLFHLHLLSKFSLYFYTTLNKQAPSSDLKGTISKNTIDYISKIITFQRKTDAFSVSLVLDAASKENIYKGHGYHMDNTLIDPPTGINSYPSVVSIPENITKEHWPNVISLLTDRLNDLNTTDKIAYLYDVKLESSYFLIKVDVRLTLVLVYKMKKKEKDNAIQNFLLEMRANLSHDKLFQMLKPTQSFIRKP